MDDARFLSMIESVQQLVPQEWCLSCRGCCRFADPRDAQTPTWAPVEVAWARASEAKPDWFTPAAEAPSQTVQLVPHTCGGSQCPAFVASTNRCGIYAARPFDCRIYPFTVTRDATRRRLTLAVDTKCPYIRHLGPAEALRDFGWYLSRLLDSPEGQRLLAENPALAGRSREEFWTVQRIRDPRPPPQSPAPSGWALLETSSEPFESALAASGRPLSSYHRAAWLAWGDLLQLWWGLLDRSPCLLAEQAGGYFLALPPLGGDLTRDLVAQVFAFLRPLNREAPAVSRIENVPGALAEQCRQWGYQVHQVESEYLYDRQALAARCARHLRRMASQPAITVRPYQPADAEPCLRLYTLWALRRQAVASCGARASSGTGNVERSLIRDGFFVHRRWLEEAKRLGMRGWVAEVAGELQGYTLGYPLGAETFVVAAEIVNTASEGVGRHLLREVCRQVSQPQINLMGDAGLASLAQAKCADEPTELLVSYSVTAL